MGAGRLVMHDTATSGRENMDGSVTQRKSARVVKKCQVAKNCPTAAFKPNKGVDRKECMRCGACLSSCPYGALKGNLGAIELNGQQIPVTLRQSDRYNADKLTLELKKKIEQVEFFLSTPVQNIKL